MHGYFCWLLMSTFLLDTSWCWFTVDPGLGGVIPVSQPFTDCGFETNESTIYMSIWSPGLLEGHNYPNKANCTWTITAVPNHTIVLVFELIDIEYSDGCVRDYVNIVDEGNLDAKFCGDMPPNPIQSVSNRLIINFHSDAANTGKGFNVSYIAQDNTGPKVCGYFTVGPIGYFEDERNETLCSWILKAQKGNRIQLFFKEFDINCELANVQVYDTAAAYGPFCGNDQPAVITSTGQSLAVFYETLDPDIGEGFEAFYMLLEDDLLCGGILTNETGTIKSVDRDFDGLYDSSLSCLWMIFAPVDQVIRLRLLSVDIEYETTCVYDRLEVYDGDADTAMDTICGQRTPVLISTGSIMKVNFVSDDTENFAGFTAEYNFQEAGHISNMHTTDGTPIMPAETTQSESTTPPVTFTATPKPSRTTSTFEQNGTSAESSKANTGAGLSFLTLWLCKIVFYILYLRLGKP